MQSTGIINLPQEMETNSHVHVDHSDGDVVDVSNPVSFFRKIIANIQLYLPTNGKAQPTKESEILENLGFSKLFDCHELDNYCYPYDTELLTLILSSNERVIKSFGYLYNALQKQSQKTNNSVPYDDLLSIFNLLKKCTNETSDYSSKLKWISEKLKIYGHSDLKHNPSTFKYKELEFKLPSNCILTSESAKVIGFYHDQDELNDELISKLMLLFPSIFVHFINSNPTAMNDPTLRRRPYDEISDYCYCFLLDSKGNMKSIISRPNCYPNGFCFDQSTNLSDLKTANGITSAYFYLESFYLNRLCDNFVCGICNHVTDFKHFRNRHLGNYSGNYSGNSETLLSEFYQFKMKKYEDSRRKLTKTIKKRDKRMIGADNTCK